MKTYFRKHAVDLTVAALFGILALTSFLTGWDFGKQTGALFAYSFLDMAAIVPLIFILIGLFDVWVPRELVVRHIGADSGWRGSLWVILLAMLQAGPLYGAFPVAYLLWKKGASVRNIFIYLGAFNALKIPMLSFEIGFLGWKFSLLRTLLSLPVFILIAVALDKMSGNSFKMQNTDQEKTT